MKRKNFSFWLAAGLSQLLFAAFLPVWLKLLSYLHPVVLVVVWVYVNLLGYFLVYYIRKESIQLPRYIIRIALAIYSVGLLVLLFFRPSYQEYNQINYIPLKTITSFFVGHGNFLVAFYNLTANVLQFLPFGVTALMLYNDLSKSRLFLISTVVILLIETAQYFSKRGSMDIDDLLLNLVGVGFGYFVYPVIQKVIRIV
ncbi:VanZ family protein [Bacillus sp. FJAT-29953]|nr:VanZ family protein [Bacillus sp. FJAT-29953]